MSLELDHLFGHLIKPPPPIAKSGFRAGCRSYNGYGWVGFSDRGDHILYENQYSCPDPEEEDFQFYKTSKIRKSVYYNAIGQLKKTGKCVIPAVSTTIWPSDVGRVKTISLELKGGRVYLGSDKESVAVDQLMIPPPLKKSEGEFIRDLLTKVGFKESFVEPWLEKNIDKIKLMPDRYLIRTGFTGLGVVINDEWALKFDIASRIRKEYGFYTLNFGKYAELFPKIMKADSWDMFTDDETYGALIIENMSNREPASRVLERIFGFKAGSRLDHVIFMAGAIHSALALNNVIKYLEPVEFCDIKGRPHHRYADDPLNNAGEQNLRFFRDTAPSEESKRWIDEYNDWRLENLIAIIHGDMKIGPSGNLVNGYFIDPSQWGMSTELDDLAYTYSDIALYQGLEWYNTQVDKYMDYRKSHDPEFVSDLIARKSYMHNKHIRAMALQQQLALRDSVMKKRDIADPVHKKAREGYHHHLEEVTAWLRNPKAH